MTEFYTAIGSARPQTEKCKNGHWKLVGKPCEKCKEVKTNGR